LLEMLNAAAMHLDPPRVIPEEAQEDILRLIETSRERAPSLASPATLPSNDAMMLRGFVSSGDPVAASLLGRSIWYGLVEPTADEAGHVQILAVAEVDPMIEMRYRAAIRHLEFALQGGVHEAADLLADAYRELAKLCKRKAKQHKALLNLDEKHPA
jgi:hypothetical protein